MMTWGDPQGPSNDDQFWAWFGLLGMCVMMVCLVFVRPVAGFQGELQLMVESYNSLQRSMDSTVREIEKRSREVETGDATISIEGYTSARDIDRLLGDLIRNHGESRKILEKIRKLYRQEYGL